MDLSIAIKIITSIGDGIILFFLLFEFTEHRTDWKVLFYGALTGILFAAANHVFVPYTLPNLICTICTYVLGGWGVLSLSKVNIRFKDYIFVFSVIFFSNTVASLTAIGVSVLFGLSLVELVQQYPLYMLLVNIWLYVVVLSAGYYLLRKRDKIQLVFSVNPFMYLSITLSNILLTALLLAMATLVDIGAQKSALLTNDGLIQPAVTILLFLLLLLFFFILSRYSFRHELLKARLRQQEELTAGLTEVVNELGPMTSSLRNSFDVIHCLASSRSSDDIVKYIESCAEDIKFNNEPIPITVSKITHPGLAALLSSSIKSIQKAHIRFDLAVDYKNSTIEMRIADLCDIMGIFIDNAVDASQEMGTAAHIQISISNGPDYFVASVTNYYSKPVSIEKIFQKGYSSKGSNRGLGLWHVQTLLDSYDHVALSCIHKESYFTQTITIENRTQM